MSTETPIMARIGSVNVDRIDFERPRFMLSLPAWRAVMNALVTARAMGSRVGRTEHDGMVYSAERYESTKTWVIYEGIKPIEEPTFAERVTAMTVDELLNAYAFACGPDRDEAGAGARRTLLAAEMKRRMA